MGLLNDREGLIKELQRGLREAQDRGDTEQAVIFARMLTAALEKG